MYDNLMKERNYLAEQSSLMERQIQELHQLLENERREKAKIINENAMIKESVSHEVNDSSSSTQIPAQPSVEPNMQLDLSQNNMANCQPQYCWNHIDLNSIFNTENFLQNRDLPLPNIEIKSSSA